MKKGIELRKVVTIVEFYDIESLIPKTEVANFMGIYNPSKDSYVQFWYTSPKFYPPYLPEFERVLKEEFEIMGGETILIHVEY